MKVNDFIEKLMLAKNTPSLYVMGGWGFPLGYDGNKERTQTNAYNRRPERKEKIFSDSSNNKFSWDCCGMVKGIVWGWNRDYTKKNGGAVYASNGLPDWDAKEIMFKGTTEQSTDFSKIDPGEFLWLDGHCGVYLGNGLSMESTPSWDDGVQITAVSNIGEIPGYHSRKWTYHGHLKCIDYSSKYPNPPFDVTCTLKGTSFKSSPYGGAQNIVGTVKLGSKLTVESLEGSSGDFAKVTCFIYLPGGFSHDNKPL